MKLTLKRSLEYNSTKVDVGIAHIDFYQFV